MPEKKKQQTEISSYKGSLGQSSAPTSLNQAGPKQAGPKRAGPKQAGPKQVTPNQASPKQASPKQATPNQATPNQTAPNQAAPNHPLNETLGVECEELVDSTYRLISFLTSCADQIHQNQLVDLSDIEAKVLALCERVSLLPKHEAVIMIDPLQELMAKMEDVSRFLGEKQQQIKKEMIAADPTITDDHLQGKEGQ